MNGARRRLKRAYFGQRVREAEGDMRASWEVLREVIGRVKGEGEGCPVAILQRTGWGLRIGGV